MIKSTWRLNVVGESSKLQGRRSRNHADRQSTYILHIIVTWLCQLSSVQTWCLMGSHRVTSHPHGTFTSTNFNSSHSLFINGYTFHRHTKDGSLCQLESAAPGSELASECITTRPPASIGRNGLLDTVATCNDIAVLEVDVTDAGFSDHWLVRWTSNLAKPSPAYTTSTYRLRRRIDVTSFQEALWSSALCIVNNDEDINVEQLALFTTAWSTTLQIGSCLSNLWRFAVDRRLICVTMTIVRSPSPMLTCWALSNSTPSFADDARTELRSYWTLLHLKRTVYWRHVVESQGNEQQRMLVVHFSSTSWWVVVMCKPNPNMALRTTDHHELLSVESKLHERLMAGQLLSYMNCNTLLPENQSA